MLATHWQTNIVLWNDIIVRQTRLEIVLSAQKRICAWPYDTRYFEITFPFYLGNCIHRMIGHLLMKYSHHPVTRYSTYKLIQFAHMLYRCHWPSSGTTPTTGAHQLQTLYPYHMPHVRSIHNSAKAYSAAVIIPVVHNLQFDDAERIKLPVGSCSVAMKVRW